MKKLIFLLFSLSILFSNVHSHVIQKNIIFSKFINATIDDKIFPSISVYKISEQTYYFSIEEIAKIYNAVLKWNAASSKVTMHLNNKKIDFKANSSEIIFEGKIRKISFPSRFIKNSIYIPSEILTSKEFSEITETNVIWNPLSFVLTITHRPNISVKYSVKPKNTQIHIEFEKPLPCIFSETHNSLVIKILKGKIQHNCININNSIVKNIMCAMQGQSALIRINFAQKAEIIKVSNLLKPKNKISIYITYSENSENINISDLEEVVNINSNVKECNNNLIPPEQYVQITAFISFPEKNEDINQKYDKQKKIIILDAGHGGEDPGAIGPNGTKEKDINLEIVYELKTIFDKNNNYEIILTRKDDTFIPLTERTNIANKHNADLFVSIHCNANLDRNINGFEIYFLSEKATDSQAAATAILENSVLKLERKLCKKYASLEKMLYSMAINEHINESSELSSFIASEVPSRVKISNNGVKQASFYVLKGAQMPAVLVESAFISNYAQETKLRSKKFRIAIADSIYEGIIKYYARKNSKNTNDK
jgi:N-acetylmuramoyl-L-alanine amidase